MRKVSKKIFFVGGIVLVVLFLFYFLLRGFVANMAIERIGAKLKEKYDLTLNASDAEFSGFKTLSLAHLTLTPENGDTLLSLDSVEVAPSLLALLRFHMRLDEVVLKEGKLSLVCKEGVCNYKGKVNEETEEEENTGKRNYARALHQLYSMAFDFVPQRTDVKKFSVSYENDSTREEISLINYHNSEDDLGGELYNPASDARWKIAGNLSQSDQQFSIRISPSQKNHELPFLKNVFKLSVGFDSLEVSAGENSYSGDRFTLTGNILSSEFVLFQPRFSDDSIFIHRLNTTYRINATPTSISLDSSTVTEMNSLRIHSRVEYTNDKNKDYVLSIKTDDTPANDFFRSLPPGMFNETDGIEGEGKLQYVLDFHLNSDEPDNLTFNSEMRKNKLRLRKYGKNSLLKMNSEFQYTAYERDRPFRTFMVGPSNSDFTPIGDITPYLRNAVLTSEDGSFFFHNGFNEDAFRKSIATNYKAKKFLRGGSTISMQLVKNVYLSRHKTVSRKAEEALLVWLIESNHLCPKERMFEVYLNIIELGPGIYGVGEASRFYFDKKPSQLSLSESIFLASLLPHPKWFKYSFDEQGNLKPYLADYYRVVSNFLLKKNLITENEYASIEPNVKLKGPAKALVIPSDTIPKEEDDDRNFFQRLFNRKN